MSRGAAPGSREEGSSTSTSLVGREVSRTAGASCSISCSIDGTIGGSAVTVRGEVGISVVGREGGGAFDSLVAGADIEALRLGREIEIAVATFGAVAAGSFVADTATGASSITAGCSGSVTPAEGGRADSVASRS